MVSSQKDRVIIIGGKESNGQDSHVVEEIDFIKKQIVSLARLKHERANANAFLVNDVIYVFGGREKNEGQLIGEKYLINKNKWREVKPQNVINAGAANQNAIKFGPASLLYE